MCVDFAYKGWEQAGKKWPLRNIKLRTSRKLLFLAGLLTVFSCFQNPALRRESGDNGGYPLKLQGHLVRFAHSTPLNIAVWALTGIGPGETAAELLDTYDEFLSLMNDQHVRDHLASLAEEAVYDDDVFLNCREISHRLQATLRKVCFDVASPLQEFTCEYGVF